MKPRSDVAKRPMFGNTSGRSAAAHAVPRREGRSVLLDRRRRNPAAAVVGVVRAAQLQHRKDRAVRSGTAVEVAAANRATDHEVVVAPRVIGPDDPAPVPAGCSVRPKSESVNVVTCSSSPSSTRRIIEGLDRLTDLRQQVRLRVDLTLMGIEAAELTEEDLPVQPERGGVELNLMTLATCRSWLPSVGVGEDRVEA